MMAKYPILLLSSGNLKQCTDLFLFFSSFTRPYSFNLNLHKLQTTEITGQTSQVFENVLKLKTNVTRCLFTMPIMTPVERERVIGMLQAIVTSSVIAQQFRCYVRTIERLRNRCQQT